MRRGRYYRRGFSPQTAAGRLAATAIAVLGLLVSVRCRPDAMLRPQREAVAPLESIAARLHVVMINGGDGPARNYQSHLLHLRELLAIVREHGVAPERITIFASDGEDPAPDLTVRRRPAEAAFWLIDGLPLGARVAPRARQVSSVIEGETLRPATREALQRWFRERAPSLKPGDVLLIYSTDHGRKNRDDLSNNAVLLWGEDLDVDGMRALLSYVPAGVRVVLVMSQCFSGSFSSLIYAARDETETSGSVCGFFASPADRYAYGCYPENRGRYNVGHAFRFLDGLAALGAFDDAHLDVVLRDRTPDVPLRTSDRYLADLLRARADRDGVGFDDLLDTLVLRARARSAARLEFSTLEALADRFDIALPHNVSAVRTAIKELLRLRRELRTNGRRWRQALRDLKGENLERFLDRHPAWRRELAASNLAVLDDDTRADVRARLLADLLAYTEGDGETHRRLTMLREKSEKARTAAYRTEVRIAVQLRMVELYTRIAGLELLAGEGLEVERRRYRELVACESLRLHAGGSDRYLADEPFPSLEADRLIAREVVPGWLGIQFRVLEERRRKTMGLGRGAVAVVRVYPDSPAAAAGLREGDIIVGVAGAAFREPHQIREWAMTSPVGESQALEIVRDGQRHRLAIEIGRPPA